MDLRSLRPMIAHALSYANDAIERAERAIRVNDPALALASLEKAREEVKATARLVGTQVGLRTYWWLLPGGIRRRADAASLNDSLCSLGRLIGWVDDDTASVEIQGKVVDVKIFHPRKPE